MSQAVEISTVDSLDSEQQEKVLDIVHAAFHADEVKPLSEHVELHLKHGGDKPISHILAVKNNEIVGYGHLDQTDLLEGPSAELVVHPKERNKGIAKLILKTIETLASKNIRLWAHGNTAAAENFATKLGYQPIREISQMQLSLFETFADFEFSDDFTLTTYQGDVDNEDILKINKSAFQDLPDQAAWTAADLKLRLNESWFDPTGLAILRTKSKVPAGYCWTKVHGHDSHGHKPLGELYVLAIAPEFQGLGLGKQLTLWSLHHLRTLGLSEAMLYVDAKNTKAKKIYTELGFANSGSDTLYKSLTQI
jgi:mycothiol synthase